MIFWLKYWVRLVTGPGKWPAAVDSQALQAPVLLACLFLAHGGTVATANEQVAFIVCGIEIAKEKQTAEAHKELHEGSLCTGMAQCALQCKLPQLA